MIDLFYKCEENNVANCADDTTPCSSGTDIPTVFSELQGISIKVFNWFGNNHIQTVLTTQLPVLAVLTFLLFFLNYRVSQ